MSLSDAAGMRLSRFGFLMGLYAENFVKLERVFALSSTLPNSLRSSVDDGLDICVDILERHPYTLEIRLTYDLVDEQTGVRDPSAYVRYYMDARMAEVTHCYIGRNWHDVLGLDANAKTVVGHRLKMNIFLSKWLDYLAELGHSPFTLAASQNECSDKAVAEA